jgi:putative FmdB family regulatory protein
MVCWTGTEMPLYEYECRACGDRFERIQKFSDPPVEVCPTCKGAVRKLISSPAFQFKGTGWYVTDYAKSGSEKEGRAGEGEGGSDEKAQKTDKSEKKDAGKTKETAAKPKDSKKDPAKKPAH